MVQNYFSCIGGNDGRANTLKKMMFDILLFLSFFSLPQEGVEPVEFMAQLRVGVVTINSRACLLDLLCLIFGHVSISTFSRWKWKTLAGWVQNNYESKWWAAHVWPVIFINARGFPCWEVKVFNRCSVGFLTLASVAVPIKNDSKSEYRLHRSIILLGLVCMIEKTGIVWGAVFLREGLS